MRRIASTFLTIMVLTCVMLVPVQAANKVTPKTVEIATKNYEYSRSYQTYDTKDKASANPIVFYADESEFPIKVAISAIEGTVEKYVFDSYGIKNVSDYCCVLFDQLYCAYAAIDIEPYPPATPDCAKKTSNPDKITEANRTDKTGETDEVIDKKLDQLLEKLDLGFYDDKVTPYGKELRAFLVGEWDGNQIKADPEDNYAYHIASREVYSRTYKWKGTNLITGKTQTKKVNVDYIGDLEVIPGPAMSQKFSFAVDRANKTLEQWSLLEKVDSWTLPEEAGNIEQVYLIGKNNGDPDECQAFVCTFDANRQFRAYMLYPGGVVK